MAKTPEELMNPSDEKLDAVEKAMQDLVTAMKQVGAAGTSRHIPDGAGEWVIEIEWKPKKDAKLN